MDAERPKSREDSVLTANTDDFIIGDRVWVNGTKPGYIQYLGETRFSPGDWAGVVLDDHSGKNDGTVAGVHYFQCEPKRGVFARLHKLTRYPLLHATPPSSLSPTPPPPIQRCLTPTRTPSPGSLREGDRVQVSSSAGGPVKTGMLRFLGQTEFAPGEWAGVELDEPLGKNDGTVAGKRYFRCPSNYGLFSPSHKVSRLTGSSLDGRTTHTESRKTSVKGEKELRQLLEAAEAEKRSLATKLAGERRKVEELEFRIEEECIGKDDLETERKNEQQKVDDLQRRLEQELRKNEMTARGVTPDSILKDESKRLQDENKSLREKLRQADVKIHELETIKTPPSPVLRVDELTKKEESLLQAQLSLDNKKREVNNLLDRMAELEKELEKSKARQARQLDAIDDQNVKLQKLETKCGNLEEELNASKEKTLETERRLQGSSEQMGQLEVEKKRLEKKLLSPDSTSKEEELIARLHDRDREVSKWRSVAEERRAEADKLREEREKQRKEAEEKQRLLAEQHREEKRREKKRNEEREKFNANKIKALERELSSIQSDLSSARTEAEARLVRQEARLQEAEKKSEGEARLRDQVTRLQAERDRIAVEKEETWRRLQSSEQSRARCESEASRAKSEVQVLRSQVQHLRSEFAEHREDLSQQLAETKFDAQAVQELHLQIEEQRRIVEEMQLRLQYTEGERDQLQDTLATRRQDHLQVENGLKQEVESLKRRLSEADQKNQSLRKGLESTKLLIEERSAAHKKQQILDREQLEKEKSTLDSKIANLQVQLSTIKNGKHEKDLSYDELKSEKEALEQQVHFMNSVIVDMQHKNDDLRSRLDILETEVIFDGHLQL